MTALMSSMQREDYGRVSSNPHGEFTGVKHVSPEDELFLFNQQFLHAKRPEFWLALVIVTSMIIISVLAFVDEYIWTNSDPANRTVFMTRLTWIIYTAVFLGLSILVIVLFYVIRKDRIGLSGGLAKQHWRTYKKAMAIVTVFYGVLFSGSLTPADEQCDSKGRCRVWVVVVGLAFGLVLFAADVLVDVISQEVELRELDHRGHEILNKDVRMKKLARDILRQENARDHFIRANDSKPRRRRVHSINSNARRNRRRPRRFNSGGDDRDDYF